MENRRSRYQQMELYMAGALTVDLILFIGYMLAAGAGIIWLQVIMAILTIGLSVLCLWFLYVSRELFAPRSLWMGVAAAAILVCLLFSIILNFPSPDPYQALHK